MRRRGRAPLRRAICPPPSPLDRRRSSGAVRRAAAADGALALATFWLRPSLAGWRQARRNPRTGTEAALLPVRSTAAGGALGPQRAITARAGRACDPPLSLPGARALCPSFPSGPPWPERHETEACLPDRLRVLADSGTCRYRRSPPAGGRSSRRVLLTTRRAHFALDDRARAKRSSRADAPVQRPSVRGRPPGHANGATLGRLTVGGATGSRSGWASGRRASAPRRGGGRAAPRASSRAGPVCRRLNQASNLPPFARPCAVPASCNVPARSSQAALRLLPGAVPSQPRTLTRAMVSAETGRFAWAGRIWLQPSRRVSMMRITSCTRSASLSRFASTSRLKAYT